MGNNSVTGERLQEAQWRVRQVQSLLHAIEAASATTDFPLISTDLFSLADELIDEVDYFIGAGALSPDKTEATA